MTEPTMFWWEGAGIILSTFLLGVAIGALLIKGAGC